MLLKPGRRKAVYGSAAFVALVAGAIYFRASFPEYRDAIVFWLGLMVGAHVAQQATQKTEAKP